MLQPRQQAPPWQLLAEVFGGRHPTGGGGRGPAPKRSGTIAVIVDSSAGGRGARAVGPPGHRSRVRGHAGFRLPGLRDGRGPGHPRSCAIGPWGRRRRSVSPAGGRGSGHRSSRAQSWARPRRSRPRGPGSCSRRSPFDVAVGRAPVLGLGLGKSRADPDPSSRRTLFCRGELFSRRMLLMLGSAEDTSVSGSPQGCVAEAAT